MAITSTSFAYRDILTPSFIKNYRYYWDNSFVTLKNGKFSEHYSIVLNSKTVHFSVNTGIEMHLIANTYYNQPIAIIILYEYDTSGNATFYQLSVLYQRNKKIIQSKPIELGEKINLKNIAFIPNKTGIIVLSFIGIGPNDSYCCPSTYITKFFKINTK